MSVPLASTSTSNHERPPILASFGAAGRLNPLATSFTFSGPPRTSAHLEQTAQDNNDGGEEHAIDMWQQRRAHTLSPHTRTHSSTDSDYSFASIIPTRKAFYRSHVFIQFPVSIIICGGLFSALYIWKDEVRWWEVGLGVTAWLAGQSLKELVFEVFKWESLDRNGVPRRGGGMGLPTTAHAILQEMLRLGAIGLAVTLLPEPSFAVISPTFMPRPPSPPSSPRRPLPPLDTLFFSALWLALGWAFIEIFWGSRDFYRRMRLYDDVLEEFEGEVEERQNCDEEDDVGEIRDNLTISGARGNYETTYGAAGQTGGTDKNLQFLTNSAFDRVIGDPIAREEQEVELDARIRRVERDEVEAQLGLALYEIPVIVVIIWRIDSILLSIVLTLFLSLPFRTTSPSLVPFPLWPTFAGAAATHAFLSLLWVLRIKFVGIPALSYFTLVLLVFSLTAVLAAWGALE